MSKVINGVTVPDAMTEEDRDTWGYVIEAIGATVAKLVPGFMDDTENHNGDNKLQQIILHPDKKSVITSTGGDVSVDVTGINKICWEPENAPTEHLVLTMTGGVEGQLISVFGCSHTSVGYSPDYSNIYGSTYEIAVKGSIGGRTEKDYSPWVPEHTYKMFQYHNGYWWPDNSYVLNQHTNNAEWWD